MLKILLNILITKLFKKIGIFNINNKLLNCKICIKTLKKI